MNIEKIKISYIIIFLCVVFKYLIEYGINMSFLYIFLLAIVIIECFKLIKEKYYKKTFTRIIGIGILTFIYVLVYKDANLLITFLLAIVLLRTDSQKFLKVFSNSSIFMYVLTFLLYFCEILQDNTLIRYSGNGITYRHSYGFTHPNCVFLFFLPIFLSQYILTKDKKKFFSVFILISIFLYKISLSRTGIYCIIALLIVELFLKKVNILDFKKIFYFIPLILFIASYFVASYFGAEKTNEISQILSHRPYLWNQLILGSNAFTIFGSRTQLDLLIDNFYLASVYRLGMFSTLTYYYIYVKGLQKINNKSLIICILIFLIYGLTESNTIIGSINFTLAFLMFYYFRTEEFEKEEICNDKK